jgi:hypothetical protein
MIGAAGTIPCFLQSKRRRFETTENGVRQLESPRAKLPSAQSAGSETPSFVSSTSTRQPKVGHATRRATMNTGCRNSSDKSPDLLRLFVSKSGMNRLGSAAYSVDPLKLYCVAPVFGRIARGSMTVLPPGCRAVFVDRPGASEERAGHPVCFRIRHPLKEGKVHV